MFLFSNTNKRYHTFNYHLKNKFNCKVEKICLNAGFTCPNIDGTKGIGGCTYCSDLGSGDFGGNPKLSLKEQYYSARKELLNKWNNVKFITYFQAHTNTYAKLDILKNMFNEALSYEDSVAITIATRPDCIDEEIAEYLYELSKKTYLIVELGLQTIHDETGLKINRCHSYDDFLIGYNILKQKGINTCIHIINGLPGESKEMMLQTVKAIALLTPHSIKLHSLHVIKNTKIAQEFYNGEFKLLELDEFVDIVCDQLELLPPETIIQRITGDGDRKTLIGPEWTIKKLVVLNSIDKEFVKRNSYQGFRYNHML